MTHELGERFEISYNSYKPFACGIVIHPSIDACVQLRNEHHIKAQDVAKIELRVHSLVLELTGKKTPQTGLESKFSVFHAAAAGLIYGQAGEEEFSDHIVRDSQLIKLRDSINATVDPSIQEDAVKITLTLKDGRVIEKYVEHAIGSVSRPLTDQMLDAKFSSLCEPVIGKLATKAFCSASWQLAKEQSLSRFLLLQNE